MSTDLKYLAFTAILTASLWIPYIACQVMTNGNLAPQDYIDPMPRKVPLWGMRANRAHINAVEAFAPFAALVIIIHLAGKANASTAFWSIVFFWARLVHALVYWFGIPYLRTLSFTIGYIAILGLFWQLL
jgi:uncharacterized MAPEG superfamily protein